MNTLPLEAVPISYFLISAIGTNNMADVRTYEVVATLMAPTLRFSNDVW
jgi:hypothetical protein